MKHGEVKRCVESLKEIRMQMHNDLAEDVRGELDGVIKRLERALSEWDEDEAPTAEIEDGLAILARILEVSCGVAELLSRFWS